MLKTNNRLRKGSDFARVFKQSRPIFYSNLVLRFAPSRSSESRFGFVVGNKVEKRATRRNHLKRQLRSLVREWVSNIKPGLDVIVTIKTPFVYPFQKAEIKRQFEGIVRKAGILK